MLGSVLKTKDFVGISHRVDVSFPTKSLCFKGELNIASSEINL
jgi:hypothetical protein